MAHPRDRFAVLIYDSGQLRELPRTDGYVFKNPNNKKAALIGIIKITEVRNKIDDLVDSQKTIDGKLRVLEREIEHELNVHEDKKVIPYLAYHVNKLLYHLYKGKPEAGNVRYIKRLGDMAKRVGERVRAIDFNKNMQDQLEYTKLAFLNNDRQRMFTHATWPDFVIETINQHKKQKKVEPKDLKILDEILEEAKLVKKQFGI